MLMDLDNKKIYVTLNNKKLYLLYNLNSILCLEYTSGRKADDVINEIFDGENFDLNKIIMFLQALLIDNYYKYNEKFISKREFSKCKPTLAEIGRALKEIDINELISSLLEALEEAMPDSPVSEDENFRKAVRK